MSNQERAVQQLAAISDGLLGLFEDFCRRNASPELHEMLTAYRAQRMELVLTVRTSISGADFVCCALPAGGAPAELVRLFTVHTVPAAVKVH